MDDKSVESKVNVTIPPLSALCVAGRETQFEQFRIDERPTGKEGYAIQYGPEHGQKILVTGDGLLDLASQTVAWLPKSLSRLKVDDEEGKPNFGIRFVGSNDDDDCPGVFLLTGERNLSNDAVISNFDRTWEEDRLKLVKLPVFEITGDSSPIAQALLRERVAVLTGIERNKIY